MTGGEAAIGQHDDQPLTFSIIIIRHQIIKDYNLK